MLVLSREVALAHVLAELADVVEGADRWEAHLLGVVQGRPPTARQQRAAELGISESHGFILVRLATASRAVTTEAPQQRLQPAGQIQGAPRALDKAPTVTLCLQRKSSTKSG
jgi:hypothetical protein